MNKIISRPGLFGGTTIHYDENGNIIGKSVPGLFGSTVIHYDAQGNIVGKSVPGLFDATHTKMNQKK